MLFTEPGFLFFFLPLVLLLYGILPGIRLRNVWLVLASLFFFAYGEKVAIMLGSIVLNYALGIWIGATRESPRRRWVIGIAVAMNIAVLAYFKYTNFFGSNLNSALGLMGGGPVAFKHVALPIGISFLTFHGMSYVIDVYRGDAPANKSFLEAALYLSLFPQLIAGPIIRYRDIADQIRSRTTSLQDFYEGVQRFMLGFAKKMLIANPLAVPVDQIFRLPHDQVTTGMAWLAVACYTLQIYFDFSGYTDMAIGLARMFGFRFLENFNYPYISTTITEFWRRWHISLSNWFRDYLFFPLGANRKGPARGYANLLIVFLLCGLWHGASWTFAIWGLYHGAFLVLERVWLSRRINALWLPLRHVYALLIIMGGWALFRSDSLGGALGLLRSMAGFSKATGIEFQASSFMDARVMLALLVAIPVSAPLYPWIKRWVAAIPEKLPRHGLLLQRGVLGLGTAGLLLLFFAGAALMAAGTYNPFIYFKF